MTTKNTLVIGASEKPDRYSNKAVKRLYHFHYPVIAYGNKDVEIDEISITTEWPSLDDKIHTISLYIRATYQKDLYEKIFSLAPKRIIFNPGTENPELHELARARGIEVVNACTLVMLSIGDY